MCEMQYKHGSLNIHVYLLPYAHAESDLDVTRKPLMLLFLDHRELMLGVILRHHDHIEGPVCVFILVTYMCIYMYVYIRVYLCLFRGIPHCHEHIEGHHGVFALAMCICIYVYIYIHTHMSFSLCMPALFRSWTIHVSRSSSSLINIPQIPFLRLHLLREYIYVYLYPCIYIHTYIHTHINVPCVRGGCTTELNPCDVRLGDKQKFIHKKEPPVSQGTNQLLIRGMFWYTYVCALTNYVCTHARLDLEII
jgi:hypothetical protein